MPIYSVDSEQMAAAVGAAYTEIEQVRVHAASLLAHLTGLQSSWQGEASTAFQGVVERWRATQVQVEEAISEVNRGLGLAAEHYGSAEQDIQRMFAV